MPKSDNISTVSTSSSFVHARWGEWLGRNRLLAGAALIAFTFVIFSGVLANKFVSDDDFQILQNPLVLDSHLRPELFARSVWSFRGPGKRVDFYRPLQVFSYWLVYRLAGPNPAFFHFVQLLFYCLTVILVWRVGCELLASELAAFAGALLWAVHPLHVEAVAWIACWPEIGFAFFYLLGFLQFMHAEKAARHDLMRHSLAALTYFPALFFKESAVSFPLMVFAYWFFRASPGTWLARLSRLAPYVFVITAYWPIRRLALGYFVPVARPGVSRITDAAALGLLGQHAKLFFWPVDLNFSRTFDLAASLRSLWPWVVLLALAWAILGRRREPRLGFLLAWWVAALLPCLDIRYLSAPILAERLSYLPSVGLCLAISYLISERLAPRFPSLANAHLELLLLGVLLCLSIVQTRRTIPNWRDDPTLAAITLRHSPRSAPMHIFRAFILEHQGRDAVGAAREFEHAMQLNAESLTPQAWIVYDGYLGLGRVAEQRNQFEMAVGYDRMAAHILPNSGAAYHALGALYFPRREYATAAGYFEQAVRGDPQDLIGRFLLGTCWLKLGKYREAAGQFAAAAAADPSYAEAYDAEARALEAAGDPAGAARVRQARRSLKRE